MAVVAETYLTTLRMESIDVKLGPLNKELPTVEQITVPGHPQ